MAEMDPSQFESTATKILRDEYAEVQGQNQAIFTDFNPHAHREAAPIQLHTSFLEAEAAEPKIAAIMRDTMLNQLHLFPAVVHETQPDILFQYTFREGITEQIRYVRREDGVQVPVRSVFDHNEQGRVTNVREIELLSYDYAQQKKAENERRILEWQTNQRLHDEFGLDEEFLGRAKLTLEDKLDMLKAYDDIQRLQETPEPVETIDNEPEQPLETLDNTVHLDKIRKKLAKAMMPPIQFLKNRRARYIPQHIAQYQNEVNAMIMDRHLSDETAYNLLQKERLLRLAELNKQLRIRHKVQKGGIAAGTAAVTTISTGASTFAGYMADWPTPVGAGLGLAIGLSFGADAVLRYRKSTKHVTEFEPSEYLQSLPQQLDDEKRLADTYFRKTKTMYQA